MTWDLLEFVSKCHISVMGHNSIPPSRISPKDPEEHEEQMLWGVSTLLIVLLKINVFYSKPIECRTHSLVIFQS